MVSALILVISVVALIHFGVYYWRALMVGVAAQPLSERLESLSRSAGDADVFDLMVCFQQMCPELQGRIRKTGAVRLYFRVLTVFRDTLGPLSPWLFDWASREMSLCARYVAVVTDQQLRRNLGCIAAIRSL